MSDEKKKSSSIFSSSFFATVFMTGYLLFAMFNIYRLMYPLAFIKLDGFSPDSFIHPLWEKEAKMAMKVYLSTQPEFGKDFLRADLPVPITTTDEDGSTEQQPKQEPQDTILLWKEYINTPSLYKSFLLSSLDCLGSDGNEENCSDDEKSDKSLLYARSWLDRQDHAMLHDDGSILSTIQSGAGHGIESTSILLVAYQSISNHIRSLLVNVGIIEKDDKQLKEENERLRKRILDRSTVYLPSSSPLWSAVVSNATLYVHVVVVRQQYHLDQPTSFNEAAMTIGQASRSNAVLFGQVDLVKYDQPNHLAKPGRVLYHDLVYIFEKYILMQKDEVVGRPPWDMRVAKPEYNAAYEHAQRMKLEGSGYPYWKPEVAIKYLIDEESYPLDLAHISGMDFVRVQKQQRHPTGIAHIPALHVDEIGMTSDKYIPLNKTVSSLPLRISFDRSDVKDDIRTATTASTATAGGISPARWRLLNHLSKSFESQRELGFDQSDIDDLRRLIADTNVTLLGITVLASTLHLLFEFLTFKNEVSFWRNNTDLTGLSVRSLFFDMIGQFIIVLYLIDKDSSLLMTVPSAIGVLIALWKCQRAAGFAFVVLSTDDRKKSPPFWNIVPRLFGYELKATRLEISTSEGKNVGKADDGSKVAKKGPDLQALTIEADRLAARRLGSLLLPLVVVYTLYSLIMEEHISWYSWLITCASSAVYAFGFVLMTPQLFLNYKLKSVAHLPWRVLVYKSLNTFIDDLFSFIIRMPTMARISCFRDDVVFFIYLYQRWLYPVDSSRPVEGGAGGPTPESVTETKKKQ